MQSSHPVSETSRILGTTDYTVRRLIKSRKLRAVKVGNQWRVLQSDLDAFLDAGANRPASPDHDEAPSHRCGHAPTQEHIATGVGAV